jgi:hypothetical protein
MVYVPNNVNVFTAAYAGAMAGMVVGARDVGTDAVTADYTTRAAVAGAFAESFDTAFGAVSPDVLQMLQIQAAAVSYWTERFCDYDPSDPNQAAFLLPATYTPLCNTIIATIAAAEAFFASQGIVPNPFDTAIQGNVFVYRVGAAPSGNVYSSFAAAYAARQAVKGFAIIEIDSAAGPGIVAAGAYDLFETKLLGDLTQGTTANAAITLADGVTFTNFTDVENVDITCGNTAVPVVTTAASSAFCIMRNSSITSTAAQPFWLAPLGSLLQIYLFDASSLIGTNLAPVISCTGTSFLTIRAFANSGIATNCVLGTPTNNWIYSHDDSSTLVGGHAAFTGTFSEDFVSDASREFYQPAVPGNWSPAPSLVGPALDQLAARGSGGAAPLGPNASWTVADWWIDPSNSTGLASDANNGTSPVTPLLTWKRLTAIWGTVSPVFQQAVTITFLSHQGDVTDPIVFKPIIGANVAGPIVLQGNFTIVNAGVVLGGVVPKNRALGANSLLQADVGVALGNNALRNNTNNSICWAYQPVGGTAESLSQPFTLATPAFPFQAEVDWTAANDGNVCDVVSVPLICIADIEPTTTTQNGAGVVVLYHLGLSLGSGSEETVLSDRVVVLESQILGSQILAKGGHPNGGVQGYAVSWVNTSIAECQIQCSGSMQFYGGLTKFGGPHFAQGIVDFDCDYVLGDPFTIAGVASISGPAGPATGSLYIDAQLTIQTGVLNMSGPGGVIYGGGGQITLDSLSRFAKLQADTFVASFTAPNLVAPGIVLNSTSTGSTWSPGGGVLSAEAATTPGNLDAAIALSGVGLLKPGGASCGSFP